MGTRPDTTPDSADAADGPVPSADGTGRDAPRPAIAVTLGDPGGIGPEIIAKTLADPALRRKARFRIYGVRSAIDSAAARAGIDRFWWAVEADSGRVRTPGPDDCLLINYETAAAEYPARADALGGDLSYRFVQDAISEALLPRDHPHHADAIVTGPISKEAWALAGHTQFPGHTELLARCCGIEKFAMMFHAPPLHDERLPRPGINVILATVHIPISQVPAALTIDRVLTTIRLGAGAMKDLGVRSPRLAVCGLNPHAGEAGLIGSEDRDVIAPAIAAAASEGIDASGPFPADTIFRRGLAYPGRPAEFDLVVAMYHDQGLTPLKMLAWDRAVNMTVGLPIVRTSPDHGTAFDIAGRNIADPGSFRAAVELAITAAAARRRA